MANTKKKQGENNFYFYLPDSLWMKSFIIVNIYFVNKLFCEIIKGRLQKKTKKTLTFVKVGGEGGGQWPPVFLTFL